MKTLFAHCFHLARWLFAILLLALTLLLVVGRSFGSFAQTNNPEMAAQLGEILGVPVTVELMSAEWQGLSPLVELAGVQLGDTSAATRLDRVVAKADVIASLLAGSPVWSRLEAANLDLTFIELPSGRWQWAGIELGGGSSPVSLEKMILASNRILVEHAHFRLVLNSGRELNLELHGLSLENAHGFHRLKFDASFGGNRNSVEFVAELTGSDTRFSELNGTAYGRVQGRDLSELYRTLTDRFLPGRELSFDLTPRVEGEFWSNLEAGKPILAQGFLQFHDVPGIPLGLAADVGQGSLELAGGYGIQSQWLDIKNVDLVVAQNRAMHADGADEKTHLSIPDFRFQRRLVSEHTDYRLSVPSLNLESLTASVVNSPLLSSGLRKTLSVLNPQGRIESISLDFPDLNLSNLRIGARVVGLNINDYRAVPGFRNLDARIETGLDRGWISVESANSEVLYPTVYDSWLKHQELDGLIGWRFDPEAKRLLLGSDNVHMELSQGSARGSFLIDTPLVAGDPLSTNLTLALGLTNSDLAFYPELAPKGLQPQVRDWLGKALVSGKLPNAAFVYRGQTRKDEADFRTVQLRAEVARAEVHYLDGWPNAESVSAQAWVSDAEVLVRAQHAEIDRVVLGGMQAVVDARGGVNRIRIDTPAKGPGNDLLDLVRATSLRSQVGTSLDSFDMQGQVAARLALTMPITGLINADNTQIDLRVDLDKNRLELDGSDLQFEGVSGLLTYDHRGLRASGLYAQLWQSELTVSIHEDRAADLILLNVSGEMEASDVREWLNLDILRHFDGRALIRGELAFPASTNSANHSSYRFESNMIGVRSLLPAPLNKSNNSPMPLVLSYETGEQITLDLTMQVAEEPLRMTLVQNRSGSFDSAALSYRSAHGPAETGVFVGDIATNSLEIVEWLDALSDSQSAENQEVAASILGLRPRINIHTADAILSGTHLGAVESLVTEEEGAWKLDFVTDYAEGSYWQFPGDVPRLELSTLDLDSYAAQASQVTESSEIDPRQIPALNVSVEQVLLSGIERGSWSAQLSPTDSGLLAHDLNGKFNSASVLVEEGSSSIFWGMDSQGSYTDLNITLGYEDLGDLFRLLAIEPPLTSSNGEFYASLNWRGGPHKVEDADLNGILGVNAISGVFHTGSNNIANNLLKAVGLVNIGSWLRRLRLDFKDVAAAGTAYDQLVADFILENNEVSTLTPVDIDLSAGSMLFDGILDLDADQVDGRLVVTLPARQNMTWITALVAGLPAAAGVWVAGRIFDDQLDSLSSVSYKVEGALDDPKLKTEKVFQSTIQ